MEGSAAVELERATARLASGGLVAFPTETVWGIAADARQPAAVERLQRFKGRDPEQAISLIVTGPEALEPLGCQVGPEAEALIAAFWPGAVTLVLPCLPGSFGAGIVNPGGGLGLRCSPHPVARALAHAAAAAGIGPLTATSCNRGGDPAAETREQARAVCRGADAADVADAPFLLEHGEDAFGGLASTVVDLCSQPPRILRAGAVPEQAIYQRLCQPSSPSEDSCPT